jgi:hypothetical protein
VKKAARPYPWLHLGATAIRVSIAGAILALGLFMLWIGFALVHWNSRMETHWRFHYGGILFVLALSMILTIGGFCACRFSVRAHRTRVRETRAEWETITTTENVLVRPATPVEEDQLLRVAGHTHAENEQLLRGSEGNE